MALVAMLAQATALATALVMALVAMLALALAQVPPLRSRVASLFVGH